MLFDDRLATVLRKRAASEAGLRTQFRQLLDLLGTRDIHLSGPALARIARAARGLSDTEIDRTLERPAMASGDNRLATIAGFVRLARLQADIPQETQSAILREPGLRLRNPAFVAFLAEGDPKPAAAAMATAQLTEAQWQELIPQLPVTARGFLRHRRDLPASARQVLERLGVRDLVLPMAQAEPESGTAETGPQPIPVQDPAAAAPLAPADDPIGQLRRRIEAFQESRRTPGSHPRLPLGDTVQQRDEPPATMLDLRTDSEGRVVAADDAAAPLVVGLRLTSPASTDLVAIDDSVAAQLRRRLPLRDARLEISAAPQISGEWRMDATPLFAAGSGNFSGYAARLYRPNRVEPESEADTQGDAMRQVLHELRTPVNAIQGFAEIIQQQLFGNVPHEYRAHAAAIAVDAAKLLAGFDEVDRLVKLETDALELQDGTSDFRAALVETIRRLEGVLRPRNAGFVLGVSGSPFDIALPREEALVLSWRLLATAASALGPGEEARIDLTGDGSEIRLQLDVPEALRNASAETGRDGQRRRAISAGMFGPRFTFRLAEAEARAAGGSLVCEGNRVTLLLPALTSDGAVHSSNGTGGD